MGTSSSFTYAWIFVDFSLGNLLLLQKSIAIMQKNNAALQYSSRGTDRKGGSLYEKRRIKTPI